MKCGKYEWHQPVFLAPMAGYTNLPFRLLCRKFGADAVFTEMISAKGLYYKDQKTAALMLTSEKETPAGIQIFGSNEAVLSEVIQTYINQTKFAFLDFNAGCPAPKIVKNKEGSALLKDPAYLGKIITTMKKVSQKPLCIKTRIGFEQGQKNIREVAEIIETAGADLLTIHGRTRADFYQGHADWESIKQVKQNAKIPIVLSGDITSAEDAVRAFETTGCDGIMIGRAAVGNPFLFREIKYRLKTGKTLEPPTLQEKMQAIQEQTELTLLLKREDIAIKEMRKHLAAYSKGLKNATTFRNKGFKVNTRKDIKALIENYLEEMDEK